MQNNNKEKIRKSFHLSLAEEIRKWTNIQDEDLDEAMNDLCGGLFKEIRKFTARICDEIENRKLPEEFKNIVKDEINGMWYNIESHQKIGVGKFCNIINKHNQKL